MFITTMAGLGSVLGIAGGINSLTGGGITSALGFGQSSPSSAEAQRMADPFMDYRGQLGAMYSGALQPGANANIQDMPGYSQFNTGVMQPAMQASQRAAAASGQLYSGGEQQALQKIGQQGYYGFMTDYLNRLAQGSGAAQNPAQAAGMGLAQGNLNQQGIAQGFGALQQQFGPGGGISKMFGGIGGAGGSGLGQNQMDALNTEAFNNINSGFYG
jgi:hypothetical protein